MSGRIGSLLPLLALTAAACSGGGGGGGTPEIEIFPATATVVPESETPFVEFSALVDGEPHAVQWVVVGPGYVSVTEGASTVYHVPDGGILVEAVTATVFAFEGGGEAEATVTVHDSAGLLSIQYDNYDVPVDIGVGALLASLIRDSNNTLYDYLQGTLLSLQLPAGLWHADDVDFAPQYLTWGGVGVEGEYHLAPAASTLLPDDGAATLHVRWTDDGTGFLWTAATTAGLLGFDGPSLLGGVTSSGLSRRLDTSPATRTLVDLVDVPGGLLWAADSTGDALVGFDALALGSGGLFAAAVVLDATLVGGTASLAAPSGIAIDAATGDLWFANRGNGTFGRFNATQLIAGGAVAPDAFFGNVARTDVAAIAVDAAGDVWISDPADGTVHHFLAGDLTASGTPVPAAILTGPWAGALALAFDAAGNLWVGDQASQIIRIDAAQLGGIGAVVVTADRTLSGALVSTNIDSLVFDDAGDLYFAANGSGLVHRVTSDLLAGTGTLTFDASYMSLDAPGVVGLAFRRHP